MLAPRSRLLLILLTGLLVVGGLAPPASSEARAATEGTRACQSRKRTVYAYNDVNEPYDPDRPSRGRFARNTLSMLVCFEVRRQNGVNRRFLTDAFCDLTTSAIRTNMQRVGTRQYSCLSGRGFNGSAHAELVQPWKWIRNNTFDECGAPEAILNWNTSRGWHAGRTAHDDLTTNKCRAVRDLPDTTNPVLAKPVASLVPYTSRTARYSISATDDAGPVPQMRFRINGEDWRPWRSYVPNGTVTLPDSYGAFTLRFQVRDLAGNRSRERAADNIVRARDTTPPALAPPVATLAAPGSRTVAYSLTAADDTGAVTHMRVRVSGENWRSWVPYQPTGTVILPDRWGLFTVWFQVRDGSGNLSFERAAPNLTRTAQPLLTLRQIDNNGDLRTCGSTPINRCTDVVKRFRTTISSPVLPPTDLLFKAWRNINGTWVETNTSPFMRASITGRVIDLQVTANLLAGLWRFQSQVPNAPNGVTAFAASEYQYLLIS